MMRRNDSHVRGRFKISFRSTFSSEEAFDPVVFASSLERNKGISSGGIPDRGFKGLRV